MHRGTLLHETDIWPRMTNAFTRLPLLWQQMAEMPARKLPPGLGTAAAVHIVFSMLVLTMVSMIVMTLTYPKMVSMCRLGAPPGPVCALVAWVLPGCPGLVTKTSNLLPAHLRRVADVVGRRFGAVCSLLILFLGQPLVLIGMKRGRYVWRFISA